MAFSLRRALWGGWRDGTFDAQGGSGDRGGCESIEEGPDSIGQGNG